MSREVKTDEISHVPDVTIDNDHDEKAAPFDNSHLQRQNADKLTPFQAAWRFRRIGFFCFLAAFSASLDGYQGEVQTWPR